MFPCPTSDSSYTLENKTEIWQVIIRNSIHKQCWLRSFIQISAPTATLCWNGANGQQTFWSGLDRARKDSRVRVQPSFQVNQTLPSIWFTKNISRKRRKKSRPSPIALEPCAGNRAAVLSLIVRMPTGGHSHAPPGTPGNLRPFPERQRITFYHF